ncbi:MAG: hypothetical protein AABX66_01775 [Nanoarchaeota archaeon]
MDLLGDFKDRLGRKSRILAVQHINYPEGMRVKANLVAQGKFFVAPYNGIFEVDELNKFESEVIKEIGLRPDRRIKFRETSFKEEKFLKIGLLEYRVSSAESNVALLLSLLGFDRLALQNGNDLVNLRVHLYPDKRVLSDAVIPPIKKPDYYITGRIPIADIKSYKARAMAEGRC